MGRIHPEIRVNNCKTKDKRYLEMLFLGYLLVSSSMALPLEVDFNSNSTKSGNLKAASPLINCGCQCSSLTFSDSAGVVQGNCRTVDGSGARWCYVDAALGSPFPATVAVPVPAPHHPTVVQPAHPEVFNPYPEPPLDCRVPIAGCPDFVPNPAPTDAFVPTNVFPDNVRGDNSNNVDDNIFPDNVRSQDLNS